MKGGNVVSEANGITQFAEGEPKRRNNDTVRVYQPLEGGNEVSEANVVTLCSKGEIPYCVSRKRPLDGACLIGINLRELHIYLVYLSILKKVVCIAFFFTFTAFRRISNKFDYVTHYFNNSSYTAMFI